MLLPLTQFSFFEYFFLFALQFLCYLAVASESMQDEEMSQSPVSWLSAGGGDPLYGVGPGSIGSTSGLTQLKEASASSMLACPIPGCGYRFETQAQQTLHRRSHFDKVGQRAVCFFSD